MALFSRQRLSKQQLKVFLPLLLLIGVLVVAKVLWPQYLLAQTALGSLNSTTTTNSTGSSDPGVNGDNVGPEFAEFDLGREDMVYNNVIKPNNFTGVTSVIDLITGPAYNANPTAKTPQQVYLRVAGVTAQSTPDDATAFAQKLNAYNGFPVGTVVIFGNEENNLSSQEWNDPTQTLGDAATKYAADFNAFAATLDHTKYKLAPAPPDMYNGVYDPVPWIEAFNAHITDCSKVDELVANVFDVTPRVPGDWEHTYQYLESHICSGKTVTHFEGWGMDPNNNPSIADQVNFYKTTKLPDGIQNATTLIVDTCSGTADFTHWFYYIRGKVFDINGNLIDPASCSQKKSTYYEFNIQRETSQNVLNNFYDEYSASCLPKEGYQLAFENTDKCGQPGVYCPANWQTWNIPGKLQMTADGKFFGLFRDEQAVLDRITGGSGDSSTGSVGDSSTGTSGGSGSSTTDTTGSNDTSGTATPPTTSDGGNPSRTESIESYLGIPNPNAPSSRTEPVSATNPLNSDELEPTTQAPLYSITTLQQQCELVVNKLKAVQNLCQPNSRVDLYTTAGVVSPGPATTTCALDTNVTGTSTPYTQSTILSTFNSSYGSCSKLVGEQNSNQSAKTFLGDLLKVNLSLETAYRPAFIVAVTTFDPAGSKNPNVLTTATDSNGQPLPENQPFQVVDYLEVRVPATASDFLPTDSSQKSSDQMTPDRNNYRDPLLATADVLQSAATQAQANQQQETDRNAMRSYGGINPSGQIIGQNGAMPVFCDINGKLVLNCQTTSTTGTGATSATSATNTASASGTYQDQIPAALATFINANAKLPPSPQWDSISACPSTDEVQIYGPQNTKKIAEQAQSIVAKLETQDVGPYVKQKEIDQNINVQVLDSQKGDNTVNTTTTVYFVSPERYGFQYFQNGMLSFLSLEQQQAMLTGKLTGNTSKETQVTQVAQDILDPSQFSPLLKSDLNKTVDGDQTKTASEISAGTAGTSVTGSQTTPVSSSTITTPGTPVTSSLGGVSTFNLIGKVQDKSDNATSEGIFWRVAGQVASLPTRMMALLTTPFNNPINAATRGCQGNFATEDWLLGKCKASSAGPAPAPAASCQVGDGTTSVTNSGGRSTTVSDGVIALALQVSKYTCTPAEVMVGIFAQETGGYNITDFSTLQKNIISGDPNEKIINLYYCQDGYDLSKNGCGPYSWTQGYYNNIYNYSANQAAIQDCVSNLSVDLSSGQQTLSAGSPDPRILGQAMCATAANYWRSAAANGYPTCSGSNQKAYALGDITPDIVNLMIQGFYGGTTQYGGLASVENLYNSLINGYAPEVAKVRAELAACDNSGTSGSSSDDGASQTPPTP